jgi:hypothetical protein
VERALPPAADKPRTLLLPKLHDARFKDKAGWKPAIRTAGILPALIKY